MARLVRVDDPSSAWFGEVWRIYESSFPPDERRDAMAQSSVFRDRRYRLLAAVEDGRVLGFISAWELEGFEFIEHIAVREDARGLGAGAWIMREFLSGGKKAVLEVEPPRTPMQERRVAFYQKLGFHLNGQGYIQPPYGEGKKPVHLMLMSRPGPLQEAEFEAVRRELHTSVYGLKQPML